MKEFKGESIIKFGERFPDDLSCKAYLSEIKWKNGFVCKKCGHTKYSLRKDYTRTCNLCHHNESPTANTVFHKVKFGLRKAFFITFEMVNSSKGLSATQVARRYEITRKTAWLFMHKVRRAMESNGTAPLDGDVQVDEFTIGGQETGKQGRSYATDKKKIVGAVELTKLGKIKRVYAVKINDYSAKSLEIIFKKYISKTAEVVTDKWRGYRPLRKKYSINQVLSNGGKNMPQIHIIIHQIKSWIRTIYSWVHPEHTNAYLNEFSFRINRSIYKDSIFHKIIERVVEGEHIGYKQIIVNR